MLSGWRQAEDPDLPAFYFDPVINPISAFRSTRTGFEDDEGDDGSWEVGVFCKDFTLRFFFARCSSSTIVALRCF